MSINARRRGRARAQDILRSRQSAADFHRVDNKNRYAKVIRCAGSGLTACLKSPMRVHWLGKWIDARTQIRSIFRNMLKIEDAAHGRLPPPGAHGGVLKPALNGKVGRDCRDPGHDRPVAATWRVTRLKILRFPLTRCHAPVARPRACDRFFKALMALILGFLTLPLPIASAKSMLQPSSASQIPAVPEKPIPHCSLFAGAPGFVVSVSPVSVLILGIRGPLLPPNQQKRQETTPSHHKTDPTRHRIYPPAPGFIVVPSASSL